MKKKSHLARDGCSNFFFFFLQEFCFKNTLFDDGTENDFFFCQMSVWIFRGLSFLFVFFFSKQKPIIFFLTYVIESSDLCAVVKYFFSLSLWFGYFVVTIWGRLSGLNAWKTFRLSITLIHFIYNFRENLANFANERDLIRFFDFTSFFFLLFSGWTV